MATRVWLLCLVLLGSASAFAEVVEFPEEEIATETVLPVFDRVEAVKNRNVLLKKHLEVGAGVGLALNEAFYNPVNINGEATYYLTDTHAINVSAVMWLDGLNNYGKDLQSGTGLSGGDSFDASLAPHPRFMVLGNYQFTAYYGKVSVSKQSVMNLTLFGVLGLGYITMNGANSIALNTGFGQIFYFTKKLGLRMDLRLFMFKGPDPTSLGDGTLQRGTTAPAASNFDQILYFNTMLTANLIYVL